jgi:methyl-accepting chemotaxis protein
MLGEKANSFVGKVYSILNENKTALGDMADMTETLKASTQETIKSIEQVTTTIYEVAQGSSEQSKSAQEMAELIEMATEAAKEVTNNIAFVEREAKTSAELIEKNQGVVVNLKEKMRQSIVKNSTIVNMVHMPYLGKGNTSMGINFGTSATVFNKTYVSNYNAQ